MAKTRRHNRIGLIIFVIVAVAACLALGYWQLSRYSSSAGTAQNLGYALQWPLFAAFFVYAYRRFVRLEAEAAAEEAGGEVGVVAGDVPAEDASARPAAAPHAERTASAPVTEIPAHLLPRRTAAAPDAQAPAQDGALAEYNRYLAQLREQDQEDSGR